MNSFLEISLFNAVTVIPMALAASFIGRFLRRPALTHLLWVLILVKLVTPPIWQVPVIDRDSILKIARIFVPPILDEPVRIADASPLERIDRFRSVDRLIGGEDATATRPRPRTLAEQDKFIAARKNSPQFVFSRFVRNELNQQYAISILMAVWGIGGATWFAIQGLRCMRFSKMLRCGSAAPPDLQQFSDEFAHRMGIQHPPTVWLMPGIMSPMLWGNGQSTLLIFPQKLLERLDRVSTGALLTHELAHYYRRDHWVRLIALMATGLFWWHPVVWWARHEIEAVEEECCDALVLKTGSSPPKRYAEAILDTIDFLAARPWNLPPLATGLSQFPVLRQRLTWIMRGPRNQNLGVVGRIMLIALACILPLQPGWLKARTAPPPHTSPKKTATPIEIVPVMDAVNEDSSDSSTEPITVTLVESQGKETTIPSKWLGFEVRSFSFDKRFVFLSNSSTQMLLDLQTGRDFDLTPFDIVSIAFSPDTNQFATIDGDRFLRLWDAEICDFQTWHIPGGPSTSVDLYSGGRWMVTGGNDGVVRVWSVASQRPIREFPREAAPVNSVRFSPDGNLLAVATGDRVTPQSGRLALFNVGPWTERLSMNWNSPAATVAFQMNGDDLTLISGDWQGRIARWSISTGELLGLLEGQVDTVVASAFSPNGSPLLEIEIPDLDPNTNWVEQPATQQKRWLFGGWPLTTQPSSNETSNRTLPQGELKDLRAK